MDLPIFKRKYYCLISGLPDIMTGMRNLQLDSIELKDLLKEELHASDFKLASLLYLAFDNTNLLNLLFNQNKEFVRHGNYSEGFLAEQIKEPEAIVAYMQQFILDYKAVKETNDYLNAEHKLTCLYYSCILQTKNEFLKNWFRFERDLRNILTTINARKYGYDGERHLIPVKFDNEVYEILLKAGAKVDLLHDEVPYVKEIIQIATAEMNMTEKEKAVDNLKWKFLDESTVFEYFTIERILSFIIKLGIVERWSKLDHETGEALFHKLVNDLKMSYEFPEEFSLVNKSKVGYITKN
jgi:hypothetical protein